MWVTWGVARWLSVRDMDSGVYPLPEPLSVWVVRI